jgi:hypothetical protein
MMIPIFTLNINAAFATISVVETARGTAMRAALIALMLTFATQAGAECGNLCNWKWWETATTADGQAELAAGANDICR